MNPYLVISDLHAHNYKDHSTILPDGRNSRLVDILRCLGQALELAKARGCRFVLVTGDIFHTRGAVRPSVVLDVRKALMKFIEAGMSVFVIPGNHDLENYRHGASSTDMIGNYSDGWNELFVAPAGEATLREFAGHGIMLVPYIHDIDEFKKEFESGVKKWKPSIVAMHQGIDDFAGEGYGETTITAKYLEAHTAAHVFSGHYHTPGRYHNVVSVGAPLHHTFGDEGDKRGCWTVSEEGVIEFHQLRFPKFVTIRDGDDPVCGVGNIARIVTGSAKSAEKVTAALKSMGAVSIVARIEKEYKTAHEKGIALATPEKMLADYIDIKGGTLAEKKDELLLAFRNICLT